MTDKDQPNTILDVLGRGILYEETLDESALPVLLAEKRERGKITISLTVDADFAEKDVWPDGDAPEDWDAKDVREVIDYCGWQEFLEVSSFDIDIYVADASKGKAKNS